MGQDVSPDKEPVNTRQRRGVSPQGFSPSMIHRPLPRRMSTTLYKLLKINLGHQSPRASERICILLAKTPHVASSSIPTLRLTQSLKPDIPFSCHIPKIAFIVAQLLRVHALMGGQCLNHLLRRCNFFRWSAESMGVPGVRDW